jgi:hypothetical protein
MSELDRQAFFEWLESECADMWTATLEDDIHRRQQAARKSIYLLNRECSQCHEAVNTVVVMLEPNAPVAPGTNSYCAFCKEVTEASLLSVNRTEVGG